MNPNLRTPSTLLTAALALAALLLAGAGLLAAGPASGAPNYQPAPPSNAECQPGMPYNELCPTIVTFEFPKRSFVKNGKVKLVHLGCNKSCNHVNYTAKHGKKIAAKGSTWFKANYLPNLYATPNDYAKQELKEHGKLALTVSVCVHPPGPKNFCKTGQVELRVK